MYGQSEDSQNSNRRKRQHCAASDRDAIPDGCPNSGKVGHHAGWMHVGQGCSRNPGAITQDIEGRWYELTHLVPEIRQVQNERVREKKDEKEKKVEVRVSPGSADLHAIE
jgi:hypothetical protein